MVGREFGGKRIWWYESSVARVVEGKRGLSEELLRDEEC